MPGWYPDQDAAGGDQAQKPLSCSARIAYRCGNAVSDLTPHFSITAGHHMANTGTIIQVIGSTPERIESMRRLQASKQFAKVADVFVISLEATQAHGLLCKEMILLMRQSERRIKELRRKAVEEHIRKTSNPFIKRKI